MFTSLPAYSTYRSRARILGIKKSARRESNPRPSPWQGDVVPLYYSRMCLLRRKCYYICFSPVVKRFLEAVNRAQGRNRTNDIRIFSPPLYQLSYLGNYLGPSAQCRRPGSNRYEYHYSRDFKSRASASSATPARRGENGRRWIRTTEAFRSRFTVCPLWPLGNPPVLPRRALKISQHLRKCKCFFHVPEKPPMRPLRDCVFPYFTCQTGSFRRTLLKASRYLSMLSPS